jgi:adenylate cyclase
MVESPLVVAFDDDDEAVLTMVALLVAQMADSERAEVEMPQQPHPSREPGVGANEVHVRFFEQDGSVFLDGDYLIRGVAGRVLRSIVQRHVATGQTEFTNKELRLDKSLDLPGFRDNLDTRLVLLKRRLDERNAPIRLERTGRGRFCVHFAGATRLEIQT